MAENEERPPSSEADKTEGATPVVLKAADLFGSANELWIEFKGERYRLRITRRGRLILTK